MLIPDNKPPQKTEKPIKIPNRLLRILQSCASDNTAGHRFPPTEVFNEGWMLRLVLDALQTVNIPDHPLKCLDGKATWYSEARLISPFLRKPKKDLPGKEKDTLGEGYTNADGVIGHFTFREGTKAGLKLTNKGEGPRQFIVVEAKMFSTLSSRTTNALGYNQAARSIACMAETIRRSDMDVGDLESVGFFVVAPEEKLQREGKRSLKSYLAQDMIHQAIVQRIRNYEVAFRNDEQLCKWKTQFDRLLKRLVEKNRFGAFSWEQIIKEITAVDRARGEELDQFYECCKKYAKHRH